MQIGIRFHDTEPLSFQERVERIHCQGFRCVHLALAKVDDLPSDIGMLTPGYAMYLKRIFALQSLDIAVLGCYLNLGHPVKEQMEKIQEKYKEHIRFAALLGCGVVGTETGTPNEAYQYDPAACISEETLENLIRNLRPIVKYAEQMGVIIAIEPVWRHIVSNADRARKVLDAIGSPNLQIILDPVNLISPEKYEQRDVTIAYAMECLCDEIAVIHLKDCKWTGKEVQSVACGLGDMDYTQIVQFAEKKKPFIHVTLENTTPENAVEAKNIIEKYCELGNQFFYKG